MPQLDQVTFLSQFFWLTIVFTGLYLILVKFCLPQIARIFKIRELLSRSTDDFCSDIERANINKSNFRATRRIIDKGSNIQFSIAKMPLNADFLQEVSKKSENILLSNLILTQHERPKNRSNALKAPFLYKKIVSNMVIKTA